MTVLLSTTLSLSFFIIPSTASYKYSVRVDAINYSYKNLYELDAEIANWEKRYEAAINMKLAATILGYSNDHIVSQTAEKERQTAERKLILLKDAKNKIVANNNEKYISATYIWNYLKSKGYSDYVSAGILGNIMVEVGGGTLQLNYKAYNKAGYYGMCQWSRGYTDVWGQSLEYQCDFLEKTIQYEFNTFGAIYKKGFNYKSFTKLTNVRAAALAFAKCYERCDSGGYGKR